ncbi:MAG: nicotinamidase-related amidase [Natronomonas sp.]|jgi:nicotinamidase-related amidase|uniref:cysteine hydrolase family protein n=1 Tax=Natronomonas sp. TaxID=2184060 RepID=UPI00398969C0
MPYREYETLELDRAALVCIDVQRAFDDDRYGERNNPDAERHIAELLAAWRETDLPVFHVKHDSTERHSPLRPDRAGNEFKPAGEPDADEPVITKGVNSAFIGTDLAARLREAGVERPAFVGFTTDHCVSTTVRMAENLGFEPYVASDATVAFDREFNGTRYAAEQSHRLALAHLSEEFATVVETATLLATLESR